jgi:hypothetical protein
VSYDSEAARCHFSYPDEDGRYGCDREVRLTSRRIQKASKLEGETAFSRLVTVTTDLFKNEGPAALYKGITPRVLRVAPGQAIVFTVSPLPDEGHKLTSRCMRE